MRCFWCFLGVEEESSTPLSRDGCGGAGSTCRATAVCSGAQELPCRWPLRLRKLELLSAVSRPRLLRSDPCSAAPYIPALNRRSTGRIRASARRRLSLRGDLRPLLPLQGFAENAHVDLLRRRLSRGRGADGRMGVELCGRRGRADQRVSAGRARQNPGVLALLPAG